MPIMAVPQMLAPKIDDLRKFYVGKDISKVPKPAVILDKAKMQRHCQSLLNAVDHLGVDFRAHVKTHKVIANDGLTDARADYLNRQGKVFACRLA